MNNDKKNKQQESAIKVWCMSFLAAMIFAFPTAVLIWFLGNYELAFWGTENAFIGSKGFFFIVLLFAITAIILPKLFPTILGKIWKMIVYYLKYWW